MGVNERASLAYVYLRCFNQSVMLILWKLQFEFESGRRSAVRADVGVCGARTPMTAARRRASCAYSRLHCRPAARAPVPRRKRRTTATSTFSAPRSRSPSRCPRRLTERRGRWCPSCQSAAMPETIALLNKYDHVNKLAALIAHQNIHIPHTPDARARRQPGVRHGAHARRGGLNPQGLEPRGASRSIPQKLKLKKEIATVSTLKSQSKVHRGRVGYRN